MWIGSEERAQASAELVAVVPLALLAALALGQLVVAAWALASAGEAARAGARAAHVGARAGPAFRRSVPDVLEPAEVTAEDDAEVTVRVRAPALIPGLPAIPVTASTRLDPGASEP
jgi:hypothetical protein